MKTAAVADGVEGSPLQHILLVSGRRWSVLRQSGSAIRDGGRRLSSNLEQNAASADSTMQAALYGMSDTMTELGNSSKGLFGILG